MIRKILIANRGEIAVRIIKACRKKAISAIAVFSDADKTALHTRLADEAYYLGEAPSTQSYLSIKNILEVAKKVCADAIHPGYGFLSENAHFAEGCEKEGLIFIGPSAKIIRLMGDKIAAKKLMEKAGVAVVPGFYDEKNCSPERLLREAKRFGFPVLVKAAGGGGGKGMRIVRSEKDCAHAIESSAREAETSFGNSTLLIEKYFPESRHIEVQIVADSKGNTVHLFERECSLQRRHQKVLEESPAPNLSDKMRKQICEAALLAAKAAHYTSVGTVEFLLTPQNDFYFLEMNTRLQVEHRVTELVTGVDLVSLQIDIANDREISLEQRAVKVTGHAVEVRLYAEDPANQFLPSTGKLVDWHFAKPIGDVVDGGGTGIMPSVIIDAGVCQGSDIPVYYDPLLAKVISHGESRAVALSKLTSALRALSAQGVRTNQNFLIDLIETPEVQQGKYSTTYIERNLAKLVAVKSHHRDGIFLAALTVYLHVSERPTVLPNLPLRFRNNPFRDDERKFVVSGQTVSVSCKRGTDRNFIAVISGAKHEIEVTGLGENFMNTIIDGVYREFRLVPDNDRWYLHSSLGSFEATIVALFVPSAREETKGNMRAPMSGKVMRIYAKPGQKVAGGEALMVLEAMKMEQTIHAKEAGTVKGVFVKEGEMVQLGAQLLEITG